MLQQLPHDLNAERSLIGSLLLDPLLMGSATSYLSGADAFYDGRHAAIYRAMLDLYDHGEPIDIVMVVANLRKTKHLGHAGNEDYIADLMNTPATSTNIQQYAEILHQHHYRRAVIRAASSLAGHAADDSVSIRDLTDKEGALDDHLRDLASRTGIDHARAGKLIRINPDLRERVETYHREGFQDTGRSPGWDGLASYYRVAKGTLNIVTGIPSHGKSELVDGIMVNMSQLHGWTWVVYSPENYPYELHVQKLVQKYLRKSWREITPDELGPALDWLHRHFILVEPDEDNMSLSGFLRLAREATTMTKIDGVVVDPWNELTLDGGEQQRETEVIRRGLSRSRWVARRNNLAFFIVAHPAKLYKDKNTGTYNVPTMYDISGSAHWFNKADNGLSVYRDFAESCVDVYIQKVRFRVHGKPGCVRLYFDAERCGLVENNLEPESGWQDTPSNSDDDQMSWIHN